MQIQCLHSWDVTPKEARRIQKDLAKKIILEEDFDKINFIAGCDVAFSEERSFAGIVILKYPDLEVVEEVTNISPINFPYIPGLLTFREAPALLSTIEKLKKVPDIFFFDGQGIAHPGRMGLATHLGIILNKPTIGCAKSLLCGKYQQPAEIKGNYSFIKDKGEIVGCALRTKNRVKPIFISPGNRIDLETAINLTLSVTSNYRIPEPTRLCPPTGGKIKEPPLHLIDGHGGIQG